MFDEAKNKSTNNSIVIIHILFFNFIQNIYTNVSKFSVRPDRTQPDTQCNQVTYPMGTR